VPADRLPRYAAFGGLTLDGGRLAATKQRCLLAVLLVRANGTVPVDELVHQVWGDAVPRTARNVLQWYVSRLRGLLPADALTWTDHGYRLAVAPGEFDVHEFGRLSAAGLRALANGAPETARASLVAALDLSTGQPYADVPAAPLVEAEVNRLAQRRHAVLVARMQADVALGRYRDLVPELTALVGDHPFDEELQYLLGAALYGAGRAADALAHCREVRRILADELGIEPGEKLRELELTILRRAPVPERAPEPGPSTGDRPSQLPPDVADFVGRAGELAALLGALRRGSDGGYPPVAVIVGEPGIGKSALAVHAAHAVRDRYPDGQIYLDLSGGDAGAIDPFDAVGQVLSSLGLRQNAIPPALQPRSAMLRTLLADRRILLVLDNASYTGQVRPLLPNTADCGVLVTTRAPLPGLGTAPPVELRSFDPTESVELLARIVGADRVAAEPGAAVEVAELLGGLPLAVRIAGTRLASHPHRRLSWLIRRLSDERHRLDELVVGDVALRTSLDLSYRTLHPAQQRAMCLLALLDVPDFATWLAAAALDCPVAEAEDVLEGLVEARLLSIAPTGDAEAPRFRYHQLVRLYAREQEPPEPPEVALRRAYGACLAAAERMDLHLRRAGKLARGGAPRTPVELGPMDAVRWFEAERATLVAVVRHAAASAWHDLAWELAASLDRFFELHNHLGDWLATAEIGLAAARHLADRDGEACLLRGLGEAYGIQDRQAEALEYHQRALELFRAVGNRRGEAHALDAVGIAQRILGRYTESIASSEAALAIFADHPDPAGEAAVWQSLGSAHQDLQHPTAEVEACYDRALQLYTKVGDRMNQALMLCSVGNMHAAAGRVAEAEHCLAESARLCQQTGFRNGEVYAVLALGRLKVQIGAHAEAEEPLGTALRLAREMADRYGEAMALMSLGTADRELGKRADSARYLTVAVEIFREIGIPIKTARALVELGETALADGDPVGAERAWREARDILVAVDAPDPGALGERIAALGLATGPSGATV
jgi:DNA-binding SARP family transcriptional activator/tetratricopeptide (TPR) repeat protein